MGADADAAGLVLVFFLARKSSSLSSLSELSSEEPATEALAAKALRALARLGFLGVVLGFLIGGEAFSGKGGEDD